MAVPRGGSDILLSLYGYAYLLSFMSFYILLLYSHFLPFIISLTSMIDLYPFALHFSHFVTPSRGDYCYEWTRLCHLISMSLHYLCLEQGTLLHSTHSLQMRLLCLSSCSLNHERVIYLLYFYLFFGLHGLVTKNTLCQAYY